MNSTRVDGDNVVLRTIEHDTGADYAEQYPSYEDAAIEAQMMIDTYDASVSCLIYMLSDEIIQQMESHGNWSDYIESVGIEPVEELQY